MRTHEHRLPVNLRITIIRLLGDLVDGDVLWNACTHDDLAVQIDRLNRIRGDIGRNLGARILGCSRSCCTTNDEAGSSADGSTNQCAHRSAPKTADCSVLPCRRIPDGSFDDGHAHRLAVGIERYDFVACLNVQVVAIGPPFQIIAADLAPVRAVDAGTQVLANLMYDWMFRGTPDYGRGSAIAIVLMILVTPIMVWNIWNARREVR